MFFKASILQEYIVIPDLVKSQVCILIRILPAVNFLRQKGKTTEADIACLAIRKSVVKQPQVKEAVKLAYWQIYESIESSKFVRQTKNT